MDISLKFSINKVLLFALLFTIIYNECDRSVPIKISNGSCVLTFCTVEEFNNKECIIDNQIVKTQYLNNIIILYEYGSLTEYSDIPKIDITKYSNGDIVLLSISSQERKFFGFKKNGGYLYGNDEINFSINSFKIIIDEEFFDSFSDTKLFISRDANNNDEYLLSSNNKFYDYFFEIYNLDSTTITRQYYKDLFKKSDVGFNENESFYSYQGMATIIEISEDEKKYIIFGSLFSTDMFASSLYFILYKINIQNDNNNLAINIIAHSTNEFLVTTYFVDVNCYNIEDPSIICFLYNDDYKMEIIAFNYSLSAEKIQEINYDNILSYLFKCIHIKNNIGAFIFLTYDNSNDYLNIMFQDYNKASNSFSGYLTEVKYPIISYDTNYKNNFIKLYENKICFILKIDNEEISQLNIYLIIKK